MIGELPNLIRVLGFSKDRTRSCYLGEAKPTAPLFVSELPPNPEPVESGGWQPTNGASEGEMKGHMEITTPPNGAIDLSWSDIAVRPGRILGIPIRTDGAYPNGMKIDLVVASSGTVLVSLPIHMTENPNRLWALFPEVLDLPQDEEALTIWVSMPKQRLSVSLELGRPVWVVPDSQ